MASGVGCCGIGIINLFRVYIISPLLARAPRVLHLYLRLGSDSGNFVIYGECLKCRVDGVSWARSVGSA